MTGAIIFFSEKKVIYCWMIELLITKIIMIGMMCKYICVSNDYLNLATLLIEGFDI